MQIDADETMMDSISSLAVVEYCTLSTSNQVIHGCRAVESEDDGEGSEGGKTIIGAGRRRRRTHPAAGSGETMRIAISTCLPSRRKKRTTAASRTFQSTIPSSHPPSATTVTTTTTLTTMAALASNFTTARRPTPSCSTTRRRGVARDGRTSTVDIKYEAEDEGGRRTKGAATTGGSNSSGGGGDQGGLFQPCSSCLWQVQVGEWQGEQQWGKQKRRQQHREILLHDVGDECAYLSGNIYGR